MYELPAGLSLIHDPDGIIPKPKPIDTPSRPKARLPTNAPGYGPFPNKSSFSLADWYWASSNKSFADFERLISILRAPDFRLNDALSVDWRDAFSTLGANKHDLAEKDASWIRDSGWLSTPITIDVPFHRTMGDTGSRPFFVGNLQHRSILSVIKEKITNERDMQQFHYYPYRATWKATDMSPEVELYGEMYASQAFREAHEEVQRVPLVCGDDPNVERVVVALMFWSDATHLTSFGSASLWPCYLLFGNESKYRRCKPSENLCYQIAYFHSVRALFSAFLLSSAKIHFPRFL